MFSVEQRRVAVELFIKYDYSVSAVIRELGYPSTNSLRSWWREYQETGVNAHQLGNRQKYVF
ncbi:transposase [Mobiluncus mulieris]|nr:transposase [Mobiluncus mulieris]